MRSDGNPGQTGDRENPSYVRDILCPLSRVELDPRNPSRPAGFDPHQQAEHKTVPDPTVLELQKNPCTAGAIHTRRSVCRFLRKVAFLSHFLGHFTRFCLNFSRNNKNSVTESSTAKAGAARLPSRVRDPEDQGCGFSMTVWTAPTTAFFFASSGGLLSSPAMRTVTSRWANWILFSSKISRMRW